MTNNILQNMGQSDSSEMKPDIFDEMDKVEDHVGQKIEVPKELEKINGLEKLADFIEKYKKIEVEVKSLIVEEESLGKDLEIPNDERLAVIEEESAYRPGVPDLVRMRVLKQLKEESENKKYKISEKKLAYDIVVLKLAGAQERAEAYVADAEVLVEKILSSMAGKNLEKERFKVDLLNKYIIDLSKPAEIGHKLGNICVRRLLVLHQEKKREEEELAVLEEQREAERKKREEELAKLKAKEEEEKKITIPEIKPAPKVESFHSLLKKKEIEEADLKFEDKINESQSIEEVLEKSDEIDKLSDQNFEISSIEPEASSDLDKVENHVPDEMKEVEEKDALMASTPGIVPEIDNEREASEGFVASPVSETKADLDKPVEEEIGQDIASSEKEQVENDLEKDVPKVKDVAKNVDSDNSGEEQTSGIIQEEKGIVDTPKKEKKKLSIAMSELYSGVIKSLEKGNPEDLAKYIKTLEKVKAEASDFEKN